MFNVKRASHAIGISFALFCQWPFDGLFVLRVGTETGIYDCVFHCDCSFRRGMRLNLFFAVLLCLTALTAYPRRRSEMSTGHTFPLLAGKKLSVEIFRL